VLELAENPKAALKKGMSIEAGLVSRKNLSAIFKQLGPRIGLSPEAIDVITKLAEQRTTQDRVLTLLPLLTAKFAGESDSLEAVNALLQLLFMVTNRPTATDIVVQLCESEVLQQLLSSIQFGPEVADAKLNAGVLLRCIGDVVNPAVSLKRDLIGHLLVKADCLQYQAMVQNLQYLQSCQLSKMDLSDRLTREVLKRVMPPSLFQQLESSDRLEAGKAALELALRIKHQKYPLLSEKPAYVKERLRTLIRGIDNFSEVQEQALVSLGYQLLVSKLLILPFNGLPEPLNILFGILRGQGKHVIYFKRSNTIGCYVVSCFFRCSA
jgi:hypothetical protein